MNALIRSELFKARSTRTTWALAAIAPAFCVLWVVAMTLLPATSEAERLANVYNMAQQAYLFTLILGVLGMAGEHRHQTITWAFLVTPRRGAVVSAKLAAYGLIGLAVAAASALATLVAGVVLLSAQGHAALSRDVPLILLGAALSTAIYAPLGVALAVLVRNQVAAVIVASLLFAYGDAFLAYLIPDVFTWLPSGAARALGGMWAEGGTLLPAWGGGLLFAGYVAAITLIARFLTLRRDVT
ncbi:ABC transporter permease [Nonomuraea sp. NPDC046802]|uniref:ABC transporter permease n=1 Tax=Nonomuraea sp. NPDC046802 TaxID=3154919 RepID=UPI0033C797FE